MADLGDGMHAAAQKYLSVRAESGWLLGTMYYSIMSPRQSTISSVILKRCWWDTIHIFRTAPQKYPYITFNFNFPCSCG